MEKLKKFQRMSQEKGITLVALVITIIILIILATVAINFAFGNNGLIQRAEDARDYYANDTSYTDESITNVESYLDEIINGVGSGNGGSGDGDNPTTVADAKPAPGEEVNIFEDTTKITDDSGDEVWIPGGFGVHEDSATDADDGIVITDGTNEFVWIPVNDYTTMYTEATGTALSGSSAGVTATTDVYSKLRIRSGDSFTAGIPNSTNVREPDILISYDTNEQYYSILAESAQEMAEDMVEEYTATYNSIKTYHGFYIGRYELTGTVEKPTVQKEQAVLTSQNWYNLKKACTNVVSTEYAQTTMVYGNQWDEVMSWLVATEGKTDYEVNTDSSSWGNYSNSSGDAAIEGAGSKQISGFSDAWSANNIYDLAGNCYEWTQEANNTGVRVNRGRPLRPFWFDLSSFGPQQLQSGLFWQ